MKNRIYNILKGTFLVRDGAFKNWRLIFFFLALAILMIA
ncbi:MAG: FtsL-like putative cell division protein, partial [Flavobacteriaceae bacterium]|nr:FtsL-like putative cell division protein [Flavobacteriaceae bacterium]